MEGLEALLVDIQRLLVELDDIDLPLTTLAQMRWIDTGLESLALMELVLHLEQAHDCTIPNEALTAVVTFGDLARVVDAVLAHRGPAC